jgi:TolA-binding protein
MSDEVNPTSSFWSRLGRTLVVILRILLVLAVIAGIAAAVYYGSPYLYNQFIQPVENNTARLSEVESKQAADVKQTVDQMAELKTRLADLETRQTDTAQLMAEMQGRVDALNSAVDAHTQTLKQLAAMQTSLDALNAASAEHETMLVDKGATLADLERQITLSRTIELLSRSRLYLSQSNFGMAKQDVQAARDLLIKLQPEIPTDKAAALQGVIARLDLALGNLPAFPVVAVDDVDIAWQLLVNGLPEQPLLALTPEPVTETPTPIMEFTPTLTP